MIIGYMWRELTDDGLLVERAEITRNEYIGGIFGDENSAINAFDDYCSSRISHRAADRNFVLVKVFTS